MCRKTKVGIFAVIARQNFNNVLLDMAYLGLIFQLPFFIKNNRTYPFKTKIITHNQKGKNVHSLSRNCGLPPVLLPLRKWKKCLLDWNMSFSSRKFCCLLTRMFYLLPWCAPISLSSFFFAFSNLRFITVKSISWWNRCRNWERYVPLDETTTPYRCHLWEYRRKEVIHVKEQHRTSNKFLTFKSTQNY